MTRSSPILTALENQILLLCWTSCSGRNSAILSSRHGHPGCAALLPLHAHRHTNSLLQGFMYWMASTVLMSSLSR